MKIAATIVLFVAALCVADGYSSVSVGDTIKSDYLNLDAAPKAAAPAVGENAEEEVIENWIDTIRRRRTRRQSRFC